MKSKFNIITLALALLAIAITASGCLGPYYTSETQYKEGKRWFGLADHQQANQISQQRLNLERQRMALEKLRTQPVTVGVRTPTGVVETVVAPGAPMPAGCIGYKVIIANLSQSHRYNFLIQGPESKSYYLGPGARKIDYFIPGRYMGTVYYNGYQKGKPHVADIGVQERDFLGESCQGYFVAEW